MTPTIPLLSIPFWALALIPQVPDDVVSKILKKKHVRRLKPRAPAAAKASIPPKLDDENEFALSQHSSSDDDSAGDERGGKMRKKKKFSFGRSQVREREREAGALVALTKATSDGPGVLLFGALLASLSPSRCSPPTSISGSLRRSRRPRPS